MIHPDLNVFSGSHEIMAPFRQGEHDGKQLFVIYLVVLFCGHKGFRHESYWPPYTFLFLTEYCANGAFTGFSLDSEWVGICRDGEDDVFSHLPLQLLEGLVLCLPSCPFHIPGELHQWAFE